MGLFADGAAVRRPGEETFRVINELVDGMITVSNDEVRTHFEHSRIVYHIITQTRDAQHNAVVSFRSVV